MVLLRPWSSRKKPTVSNSSGRWMASDTTAIASDDEWMGWPACGGRQRLDDLGTDPSDVGTRMSLSLWGSRDVPLRRSSHTVSGSARQGPGAHEAWTDSVL